jgi:hypothetical protein
MSISIRVRAIPPAAEDVGARSLIPEDVDLEAIVHRGEDDCVIDAEGKPAGELAPFLDEVDVLGPPLELHLDDAALAHVQPHLHRRVIVFQLTC